MLLTALLVIAIITASNALPSRAPEIFFPHPTQEYKYTIKSKVGSGTQSPDENFSFYNLDCNLLVQPYDSYRRVRFTLSQIKASKKANSKIAELTSPWEIDYLDDGSINYFYANAIEETWITNIKKAISLNFQMRLDNDTYYNDEPCFYETRKCRVLYVRSSSINGSPIVRKFSSLPVMAESSAYKSWVTVPLDYSKAQYVNSYGSTEYSGPLDNIGTADRKYFFNEKFGLSQIEVKAVFKHRTRSHVLAVTTDIHITALSQNPLSDIQKLEFVKTYPKYEDVSGVFDHAHSEIMMSVTYKILLDIAKHGIDTDIIVKDPKVIHALDFAELLKAMSQMDYQSLTQLYIELALGTSYEVETARNIFLEVLPHVPTTACNFFVKYLVIEQKGKIEDVMVLSLIRKLPFNVKNHTKELLDEFEVFTRLSLDFSQDIRHAGILSFATLVSKAVEVRSITEDYLDNILAKYFRMYNDCPQYIDRLVWLQGLSNIQYGTENYLHDVYNNDTKNRHERYWAIQGVTSAYSLSMFQYQNNAPLWHILVDTKSHIHLRIAALTSLLTTMVKSSELLSIHNYIQMCDDAQLKKFWYTTLNSLEDSGSYNLYRVASNYLSFVKNMKKQPENKFYATGNYIIGSYSEKTSTGAMLQILSIGDPQYGAPGLLQMRLKTVSELIATSDVEITLKMEGVGIDLSEFSSDHADYEGISKIIKERYVPVEPRVKPHIEIVVKVHGKTVFATYYDEIFSMDKRSLLEIIKPIVDLLTLGGHINQQTVHFPLQLDAMIPTELGTPIHLHTSLASFSSLRGNVTIADKKHLDWAIDFHIRYQGTAVTSLSSTSPIDKAVHTAKVQQTVVAHLPINFNIKVSKEQMINVTWNNPGTLDTGIAMHSKAEVTAKKGNITKIVGGSNHKNESSGSIFDCKQDLTDMDIFGKLQQFDHKQFNYQYIQKLQPSLVLLDSFLLLTTLPSKSCGFVIGGKLTKKVDDEMRLVLGRDDDGQNLMELYYGESKPGGQVYFDVKTKLSFISLNNETNLNFMMALLYPGANNSNLRKMTLCLKNRDTHAPEKETKGPLNYEGQITMYASTDIEKCPLNQTEHFEINYKGLSNESDGGDKILEVTLKGNKIKPYFQELLKMFEAISKGSHVSIEDFLKHVSQDEVDMSFRIKESNGLTQISVNEAAETSVDSSLVTWVLGRWPLKQILAKYGLLHTQTIDEMK